MLYNASINITMKICVELNIVNDQNSLTSTCIYVLESLTSSGDVSCPFVAIVDESYSH